MCIIKSIRYLFILISLLFIFSSNTNASEAFRTTYNTSYTVINEKEIKIDYDILLKSKIGDIVLQEYSLLFPTLFTFKNVEITFNNEKISPKIQRLTQGKKLTFLTPNANTGNESVNKIKISFIQKDLIVSSRYSWQVFLPSIETDADDVFNATLIFDEVPDKKITLSKPKPSNVVGNRIYWDDIKQKAIYIIIGDSQLYDVNLDYALINQSITMKTQEIVIPPDTLYQKIYINSLKPKPKEVKIDKDGNYLALYTLYPKSSLLIKLDALIQIYVKPQSDILPYIQSSFNKQRSYLLTKKEFWTLPEDMKNMKTFKNNPKAIVEYISNAYAYSYTKALTGSTRMGAQYALKNPKDVVCTEYTDTFIALARDNGIFARELQGYTYSQDERILPFIKDQDILHTWAEYYDQKSNIWLQIDPTWQDSSKIDYFNSFDLNHIVFVIHGKNSDYPNPAGTYKITDSKDIEITVSNKTIIPKNDLKVDFNISKNIQSDKIYTTNLNVYNNGNSFEHSTLVKFESSNIVFTPNNITIPILAPYQKSDTVQIKYKVKKDVGENKYSYFIKVNNKIIKIGTTEIDNHTSLFVFVLLAIISLFIGVFLKYRNK